MRLSRPGRHQYKLLLCLIYNFTSVKIAHNNFVSIGKLAQIGVCGPCVWRDNDFCYYFHHRGERRELGVMMQMVDKWDCYVWWWTWGWTHFGLDWEYISLWSCWPIPGPRSPANVTGGRQEPELHYLSNAGITVDVADCSIVHNDIVITERGDCYFYEALISTLGTTPPGNDSTLKYFSSLYWSQISQQAVHIVSVSGHGWIGEPSRYKGNILIFRISSAWGWWLSSRSVERLVGICLIIITSVDVEARRDWRVCLVQSGQQWPGWRDTSRLSCSTVFSLKGFWPDNKRYGSLERLYSNIGNWSSVTRSELLCVMSVSKWQENTQFVTESTGEERLWSSLGDGM